MLWEIRLQLDKLVTTVGRLPSAEALRDNVEGIRHLLGLIDDDIQKGPSPPAELPDVKAIMAEYNEKQLKRRFAALGVLAKAVAESRRPLSQADFDALVNDYEKDQRERRLALMTKIAATAVAATATIARGTDLVNIEGTLPCLQ